MCTRIYCTRYIWLACLRKKKPKKSVAHKIGIQIFRYRWHGDQVWPKGTILQWRVSGLCLSSTAIWMSPYGGVVAYRLEWGASYACMYARLSTSRFKRPHVVTRISWETVASKRREPTVNRVLTRPPSRLLGCNGVSLEHLSRISAHSKRYRTIWRCNN